MRIWILNRILDKELLAATRRRIIEANEQFVELGIDWNQYVSAPSRARRINALIGINHARNEAFRIASRMARFVFVLDGDNFFDKENWKLTIAEITNDQRSHPDRTFYALPIARVFLEDGPEFDLKQVERQEPILVFRNDADQLFDQSASFGQDDKVKLLLRLELRSCGNHWYPLNSEGPCAVVGTVLHLCTGSKSVEHDIWARYMERRESLNRILAQANAIATKVIMGNSMSRAVSFKVSSGFLTSCETLSFSAQKLWFRVKLQLKKLLVS